MVVAIVGNLLGHWQILLGSALAGLALGVAVLVAAYLAPLVRLRLAADGEGRARVLEEEFGRLRRMEDAVAILEEHGRKESKELRREAGFRGLLLRAVEKVR